MVYNQEHMLFQWHATVRLGGMAGTAVEEVSGQIRFAGPGLEDANTDQSLAGLTIVLARYWNQSLAKIPANCWLDGTKWNKIDVNGHYADPGNTRQAIFPGKGGSASIAYPTQIAWATTWLTDFQRGLAARGRTFWPTGQAFDQNTMRVAPSVCSGKALLDGQLLKDLTFAARNGYVTAGTDTPDWAQLLGWQDGGLAEGSGVSPVIMSKIGAGRTTVITGAGVGDRLDTQRRRANNLSDTRSFVQLSDIP